MQVLFSILFWSVFAVGAFNIILHLARAKAQFQNGYREAKMRNMTPLEQIRYTRSLLQYYSKGRRRWIKFGTAFRLRKLVQIAQRDLDTFTLIIAQLDAGEEAGIARALEVPFEVGGGKIVPKTATVH